jgi:hypothetical protein
MFTLDIVWRKAVTDSMVLVLSLLGGGLCGVGAAVLVIGLVYLQLKTREPGSAAPDTGPQVSRIIKLGAAAPRVSQASPPTLPTEPDLAMSVAAVQAAIDRSVGQTTELEHVDDTWNDGEPLTQVRRRPQHVSLEDLTGKVVLTSGAGVLIENASGKRVWSAPRVHADVVPSIWLDHWGPLKGDELVRFAQHYRKVENVLHERPERLPTLLQELGYSDVGEWFRVYNTFLKHYGVGGPGDTIADFGFGQDFQDALFAAAF